jgi:hypothetical protein
MIDEPLEISETAGEYQYCDFPIIGTAPMIVAHALPWDIGGAFWETQPLKVREAKDKLSVLTPEQHKLLEAFKLESKGKLTDQAEAHLRGYWLPDLRPGFPVSGFMGACRTAVIQYKGKSKDAMTAKKASGAFSIFGDESYPELVALVAPYSVRTDIAKNSGLGGAPRIATRIQIANGWRATLRTRYVPRLVTDQAIAQIISWAGDFGVGQWRPGSPKGGTCGTWRAAREGEANG